MTLTPVRKLAVLLLPWVFLAVFAVLYVLVLVPRVRDGAWLAICVGAFVALVFLSFLAAAVTFSRDVLTGRWPATSETSQPRTHGGSHFGRAR